MPRVIFCIGSFFPHPTGATYSSLRLAQNLRLRGANISYLVEDLGPEWRKGGEYDGFPVRSFQLQLAGKLKKLRSLFRVTRHIHARRCDFDIFHIHGGGYVNLFLGFWVGLVTGKKTLMKITLDGWDTPDGMAGGKWGRFALYCYRRLDGVVAMTSGQAVKCKNWKLPARIAVIPNGVDCKLYRPLTAQGKLRLRDELKIPHDALVLSYVGWIGRRKGTDVLVEAWNRLQDLHGRCLLLLVGDYMTGRGLASEERIDLPESPWVRAVGHVDDAERYLQASDVFVFPSRQEGFGTVQIEAMACGLPCVVNDLPGVSCDIYPDDTCGFRIAENRVADYVEKIDLLISDPALRERMGRAGRERAVNHFSLESVAERYLDFYRSILGDNPR